MLLDKDSLDQEDLEFLVTAVNKSALFNAEDPCYTQWIRNITQKFIVGNGSENIPELLKYLEFKDIENYATTKAIIESELARTTETPATRLDIPDLRSFAGTSVEEEFEESRSAIQQFQTGNSGAGGGHGR